jgi:hypothetical protein
LRNGQELAKNTLRPQCRQRPRRRQEIEMGYQLMEERNAQ